MMTYVLTTATPNSLLPVWLQQLLDARARGATIQQLNNGAWFDLPRNGMVFVGLSASYRIKPNTTPDPCVWGASIPGREPVPERDAYVPLTNGEIDAFMTHVSWSETIAKAHRAGWDLRRTP